MAELDNILNIDQAQVAITLQKAANKLAHGSAEFVLDFSSLRRIDSNAVRELEKLAATADEKSVKVSLRGVNVDLYKTLKLVKLTHRFSFVE
jgi:anti-anti-sigma regulatory factor